MTAEHTTPGPQRERKQVVPLGSTGVVEPEKPKMQAPAPAPQSGGGLPLPAIVAAVVALLAILVVRQLRRSSDD